ncbi:YbaB/EbfC family nucleoid-associated protein, partial [Amycolatopsis acidicola]
MTTSETPGDDPFAAFGAEMAELKAKAERIQESVRAATATVSSPDGSVTVTVGAGGVVTGLEFGKRAYDRRPAALSALVLQLLGKAQQQIGAQVAEAFGGLVGENSAAMEVLQEYLPEEDDEEEPEDEKDPGADYGHEADAPPPPAARPAPQQTPRPALS